MVLSLVWKSCKRSLGQPVFLSGGVCGGAATLLAAHPSARSADGRLVGWFGWMDVEMPPVKIDQIEAQSGPTHGWMDDTCYFYCGMVWRVCKKTSFSSPLYASERTSERAPQLRWWNQHNECGPSAWRGSVFRRICMHAPPQIESRSVCLSHRGGQLVRRTLISWCDDAPVPTLEEYKIYFLLAASSVCPLFG